MFLLLSCSTSQRFAQCTNCTVYAPLHACTPPDRAYHWWVVRQQRQDQRPGEYVASSNGLPSSDCSASRALIGVWPNIGQANTGVCDIPVSSKVIVGSNARNCIIANFALKFVGTDAIIAPLRIDDINCALLRWEQECEFLSGFHWVAALFQRSSR